MGAQASKQATRRTPARYVARPLPRTVDEIETEYTRAQKTIKGINEAQDAVSNTGPQPWIEGKGKADHSVGGSHSSPKWWMNTWLEMMDQAKEDKVIVSGQLPLSWERDKHEPYTLVKNRIDQSDLIWLLEEGKNMPIDELVKHTKLDRKALEDIIDTVEVPRVQFRNYKGKLTKTITDSNEFLTQRKEEVRKARDMELLRKIGYTDEELEKEDQYLTKRSRGVRMLDDLGVSVRDKQRRTRAEEKRLSIEEESQKRLDKIAAGEYIPTNEEMSMKKLFHHRTLRQGINRTQSGMEDYNRDMGADYDKITDWLTAKSSHITPPDNIYGVPMYHSTTRSTKAGEEADFELSSETYADAWQKYVENPKEAKPHPADPPGPSPVPNLPDMSKAHPPNPFSSGTRAASTMKTEAEKAAAAKKAAEAGQEQQERPEAVRLGSADVEEKAKAEQYMRIKAMESKIKAQEVIKKQMLASYAMKSDMPTLDSLSDEAPESEGAKTKRAQAAATKAKKAAAKAAKKDSDKSKKKK